MSFKKNNKSKDINYKARLEHKLYLARETPENIFDISDCALKDVPSGVYSLCKVFRKRVLLLHSNRLTSITGGGAICDLSLITILDLHSNELNCLPSDIVHLASLQELYVQENNIKKLPNEITQLRNLSILNVSKNNLKSIPENIGHLKKLKILNISYNKDIDKLPKSLGYAQQIMQLETHGLKLTYPSADIINAGTIIVIAYLAGECGIDYAPEECFKENEQSKEFDNKYLLESQIHKENDIEATLKKLEKIKEQRQTTLLDVEKNIKQQQKQEFHLHNLLQSNKKKLLEDLAHQQVQLAKQIVKVQLEKDNTQSQLLSYINIGEKEAEKVIKEFLRSSEEQRQSYSALLEQEKQEEMRLLSKSYTKQSVERTKDTLLAMEKLLEEELLKEKRLERYTENKNFIAQSLLNFELKNNDLLVQVMQDQQKNRQELVETLKKDELLQKAMVAALLERSDARSWSIVQQVHLVQTQLAALTNIELERRRLKINEHLNDIADKRVTLSAILVNLLDQQRERRSQILETITQMENSRNGSTKEDSLFWLLQYQSLMETRPQGLLETLDPNLVQCVALAGALHCLPFLSTLPAILHNLDDEQLISIGIKCPSDISAIKTAVEIYLSEKKLNSNGCTQPSAPPEEPCSSSCQPEFTYLPSAVNECVICLDLECEIIFLPCGHLCCCGKCSEMISQECPMCRSSIERKIRFDKT